MMARWLRMISSHVLSSSWLWILRSVPEFAPIVVGCSCDFRIFMSPNCAVGVQQLMDCAGMVLSVKSALTAAVSERRAALEALRAASAAADPAGAAGAGAGAGSAEVAGAGAASGSSADDSATEDVEDESGEVTPGEVLGGVHSWPANACLNVQCLLLPTPVRTRGVVPTVPLRFSEDRETSPSSSFAVVVYRLNDGRGNLRCSQPFRADTAVLNDAQTSTCGAGARGVVLSCHAIKEVAVPRLCPHYFV